MTGRELFERYSEHRDFSGSSEDKYAQTLQTALMLFGDEVFEKLEDAERQGKRVGLGYPLDYREYACDPDKLILV